MGITLVLLAASALTFVITIACLGLNQAAYILVQIF